tara:strand:+ start:1243 stop:1533 length:291 start_codon:yes stop_codon:yes gene_type:complete
MSSPFQKQFTSKSPLNGAYESGADSMVYVSSAPAFDKLQNQINASTKEAMYGLSKNKKDKDKKNKEFKNQLEKVSDSTKEITGNNFILKGYDPKEF